MEDDPLAALLEEDDLEQYDNLDEIPCLEYQDAEQLCLDISDLLSGEQEYAQNVKRIISHLSKHADSSHDINIRYHPLTVLECQAYDPLYGLKHILHSAKTNLKRLSLSIDAVHCADETYGEVTEPLNSSLLSQIFGIIRDCISNHKLTVLDIQWVPVHAVNYDPIICGLIEILSISSNRPKSIGISMWITSEWLDYWDPVLQKQFATALRDCTLCSTLNVTLFQSHRWSRFSGKGILSIIPILDAIGCNPFIDTLSLDLEHIDHAVNYRNPALGVRGTFDSKLVSALIRCFETKTVRNISDDHSDDLHNDQHFTLNLNCASSSDSEDWWMSMDDMSRILEALLENEDIALDRLRVKCGGEWDYKSMRLLCDLMEDEVHCISDLEISGLFVSAYHFGTVQVVGFDQLVDCLTADSYDDDEDEEDGGGEVEVQRLKVGIIEDEEDVFHGLVLQLIEGCAVWMEEIHISFRKFSASFTEIMESFLKHLQSIYVVMRVIEEELKRIFEGRDIVCLVMDFCKMGGFRLHIIDSEEAHDLEMDRAEFRDCLYALFEEIEFEFTRNDSEQNRIEFNSFSQMIAGAGIGIWRGNTKSPENCVSKL